MAINKDLEEKFGEGSGYLIAEEHLHDIGLWIDEHYWSKERIEEFFDLLNHGTTPETKGDSKK